MPDVAATALALLGAVLELAVPPPVEADLALPQAASIAATAMKAVPAINGRALGEVFSMTAEAPSHSQRATAAAGYDLTY